MYKEFYPLKEMKCKEKSSYFKKAGAFILFLSVLLCFLTACEKQREVTYYQYFDTVITLSADSLSRADFEKHVKEAEEKISFYHRLFDIYHEYAGVSNLCTVNKAAGSGVPVRIDKALFDFLSAACALYETTNGQMNIMMGAVTSLWNGARENAESGAAALPTEATLAEAKKHTAIESLVLDEEKQTAYISDPDASIDVGAFGKGYAAERVAEHLKAAGVSRGFVLNFGGNLRVIGNRKSGAPFTSGIHDPLENALGTYALFLSLDDCSLVTSGSYFRYFEIEGVRYHHLIDPETARPADRFVSVSVLGKDSGVCDALSTALFVMDRAEGEALVDSLDGYEAVWILPSGEMLYTKGMEKYIIEKQ